MEATAIIKRDLFTPSEFDRAIDDLTHLQLGAFAFALANTLLKHTPISKTTLSKTIEHARSWKA